MRNCNIQKLTSKIVDAVGCGYCCCDADDADACSNMGNTDVADWEPSEEENDYAGDKL